jgi:hypothetical protein
MRRGRQGRIAVADVDAVQKFRAGGNGRDRPSALSSRVFVVVAAAYQRPDTHHPRFSRFDDNSLVRMSMII